jgi:hypothetical protein
VGTERRVEGAVGEPGLPSRVMTPDASKMQGSTPGGGREECMLHG